MAETNKTRVSKTSQGYGYKYTDLAQIHEYLENEGLWYYQFIQPEFSNDKTIWHGDYIFTQKTKKNASGVFEKFDEPVRGVKVVDAVLQGIKNPAQEQGSATTYARRYSLLMAFGLATEDDDAAKLTKPPKEDTPKDTKILTKTLLTPKQLEMLNKNIESEIVVKALEYYKKEIKDLTVVEASTIIKKIMKKEEK